MKYNKLQIPQFYCLAGNEGYRLEKVFQNLSLLSHKCVLPFERNMGSFVPKEIIDDLMKKSKAPQASVVSKLSEAEELEKFASLKERGLITEEEYNHKKKEILGL